MQKLKSLLEGIYSAQHVFYEVSSGEDKHLLLWSLQQPAKGITKGPPQMRGSLSIAT